MPKPELEQLTRESKIDLEIMAKLKSHGRGLYIRVPGDIAGTLRLKPGDVLRVRFESLIRAEETQETAGGEEF